MPSYNLLDIASYALANCPAAFRIVNDVSKYTFVRNLFVRDDGSTFEGHALHVGYLDRDPYGDCWYAVYDPFDRGIAMYHGRPDEELTPAGEPFARPTTANNISDTIYPFSLAMNHPLSTAKGEGNGVYARQQKRFRLLLLVEFAHLLTGRLKHIDLITPPGRSLLDEFVALCELMQRQKDMNAKRKAKKVTRTAEKRSVKASAQDAKPKQNTNNGGSVAKRDLKRKAVADDDSSTATSQGSSPFSLR